MSEIKSRFIRRNEQQEAPRYWGTMLELLPVALQLADPVTVRMYRVAFGDAIAHETHRHPCDLELILVLEGEIEQTINNQTTTLQAWEGAVIASNDPHSARPLRDGTVVLVVLVGSGGEGYVAVEDKPDPRGSSAQS